MSEPDDTARTAGTAWWVLVGLTFVVTSEAIRVAFPLLYDVREDAGASRAIAWALGAFVLVPSLAPLLRRIAGPGRALRYAVTVLAAALVGMQLVQAIPVWLAGLAVAMGVMALALELHASRARGFGAGVAVTFTLALAVDSAIRGAYETWDFVWQEGTAPTTVAAVLAAVLLAAALGTGLEPEDADAEPRRPWTLALIGPFLLLQTLYLQNVAFLASESLGSMVAATLWVMAGNTATVVLVASLARRPSVGDPPVVRVVAALALIACVSALALTDVNVIVPAQLAAGALLLWSIDRPVAAGSPASSWRTSSAVVLGMAAFVGGAFAYQIDIDVPLPVPRATWPILAAVLLALAAVPHPARRAVVVPRRLWLVPAGLLLAVGAGLTLRTPSMQPVGLGDQIRVMSWNIHTAVNAYGNVDLASIASEIERQDPDVVLLQEVGRGWPIAGQSDQAEWLARRLDMDYAWASAADDQFGNVILSRLPILEEQVLRLPYGEGPQYRSALRVWAAGYPGREVWFVVAHLQNGDKAGTREAQIVALLDAWGADRPTVLGGDLNMEPTEENVGLFTDAGFVSTQDTVGDPSMSTARHPEFPGNRVDWIWVSADLVPSDFAIVPNFSSDHLPLVVTVSLADG